MEELIPKKGTKEYEIFEEFKKKSSDFIDELHVKGFLRKKFTVEEETLMEILTKRLNAESSSIHKLEELLISNEKELFFQDVNKHGLLKSDIMNFYMVAFTHQLLTAIERFKKYLLSTIDKKALGLRNNPTLGDIFQRLEQKKIMHSFDTVIDNKLRNALGHSSYYWKNSEFCYTIDSEYKKTEILTLGELFTILRKIAVVSNAFNSIAFEKILKIMKE